MDNSNNLKESNPEAEKPGPVSNALDAMVGMVLRLADVMGVGGVYPPSSYADRIRFLLDLRGAQYATDRQFQPGRSGIYRDQPAARRRCRREGPV